MSNFRQGQGLFRSIAKLDSRQAALWGDPAGLRESQHAELRRGVPRYVAQATPQFDAEIAEKGHLWMETI
jgi:hypothetical protein